MPAAHVTETSASRPRSPRYWRPAAIAALCAAAASPVWGAVFLDRGGSGEDWLDWAAKVAFAAILGSFFVEPVLRHLQAGAFIAGVIAAAIGFWITIRFAPDWMGIIVIVLAFAGAYRLAYELLKPAGANIKTD